MASDTIYLDMYSIYDQNITRWFTNQVCRLTYFDEPDGGSYEMEEKIIDIGHIYVYLADGSKLQKRRVVSLELFGSLSEYEHGELVKEMKRLHWVPDLYE